MPQPTHRRASSAPLYTSWKEHESVGINLSQVPKAASTHDIYDALKKEGTIVKIDLYETADGHPTTRGFVRFWLVFLLLFILRVSSLILIARLLNLISGPTAGTKCPFTMALW